MKSIPSVSRVSKRKMQFYFLHLCVLLCSLSSLTLQAATGQNTSASLFGYRGINVTLGRALEPCDLSLISEWGVNLVRLGINSDPTSYDYDKVYMPDGSVSNKFLEKLDETIATAGNYNIKVIVDMHSSPGLEDGGLWLDYKYWENLYFLWDLISKRYVNNKNVIGYDLLNEPSLMASAGSERSKHVKAIFNENWQFPEHWRNTPRDYFLLMQKLTRMINKNDPNKLVIIEGVGLGGRATNFKWMEPVVGDNIVYSFHTYVPRNFGDLGKGSNVKSGVYYRSSEHKYLLEKDVEPVIAFAKKHGVQVFVGEFGLTPYAEGNGATDWITDWMDIFEKNKWSWTYWSYSYKTRRPDLLMKNVSYYIAPVTERLNALKIGWRFNNRNITGSNINPPHGCPLK